MAGPRDSQPFFVILPVWGESYIRSLRELCLCSLLSPGNLPAIARRAPLRVLLCTKEPDRRPLEQAPEVRRLSDFAAVEVLVPRARPEEEQSAYGYFSACYRHGLEMARCQGAAAILLTADQVWADGAMNAIARRILEGHRAVLVAGPRLLEQTLLPALNALRDPSGGFGAKLTPRALVRMACEHLHPWDRSLFRDEADTGRPASFLYWDVPGQGYLMHCLHLHPVCVRTDGAEALSFRHTIDGGDFVERVAGSFEGCYVVPCSDEVMYCSIAPAEQSAHLLDEPRSGWRGYAHWCLSMGVSRINLAFLQQGIRFCLGDPDPVAWAGPEARARELCAAVRRHIEKPWLLLYARVYFILNHRFGRRLRSSAAAVWLVKRLRALLGLSY